MVYVVTFRGGGGVHRGIVDEGMCCPSTKVNFMVGMRW
jgi:hypothetical protein